MANTPNYGFVSYLGSYGLGSNLQFDEHVAKTAERNQIQTFEFELPQQQRYRAEIKAAIDQQRSTLILLCGRAGDGKTHFLRTLFTDPDFIGGEAHLWNQSPNFFEFTKGPITFTLVKDFTSNDSAADQRKLQRTIEAILAQQAAPAPAPADTCSIVLIAGNNGKILERFQSFYGEHRAVNSFIRALERYMLEHDRRALDELHVVQCHDMSACLGSAEIANIYTEVLGDPRWEGCAGCQYASLCPIVRNREVLRSPLVLTRLLQIHELLVDNGLHFTMRNVLLLIVNALLGRTKDDKYLNCNVVMRNFKSLNKDLAEMTPSERATKGEIQIMKSPLGSQPFDNLLGLNLTVNSKRGRKKAEDPLSQSFLSDDTMPIFHELATLGLGSFSTKLIDEFLVLGGMSYVFSEEIAAYHHKLAAEHDHYGLFAKLQEDYQKIQEQDLDEEAASTDFTKMQWLLGSLRRLLFFVLPDAISDAIYQPVLTQAQAMLAAKQGTAPVEPAPAPAGKPGRKPFFAPFLLTAYPFALDYLKLKHEALKASEQLKARKLSERGLDLRHSASFDIASQLMRGLNRAFTNLMLLSKASDNIYITTNNKIDPTALSVIYDRDRYCVLVDYLGSRRDNAIRFEINGAQHLTLVFNAPSEYDELPAKKCYLELTPKLFEYLMALAAGTVGLSFSQEHSNDLAAFKASIDATIAEQISLSYQSGAEPDFDQLFNNIQICQLNEAGGLD